MTTSGINNVPLECFMMVFPPSYWGAYNVWTDDDTFARLVDFAIHRREAKESGDYATPYITAVKNHMGFALEAPKIDVGKLNALIECVHTGQLTKVGLTMEHGRWQDFEGGQYVSDRIDIDTVDGSYRMSYRSEVTGESFSRPLKEWGQVVMCPDGKYRSRFIRVV